LDEQPFVPDVVDLGGGTRGVVLGAYAVGGKLGASANAPSDVTALRSQLTSEGSAVELHKVEVGGGRLCVADSDVQLISVYRAYKTYQQRSAARPIAYPDGLGGQLSVSCLNSNSFAQSLIANAVWQPAVTNDVSGLDLCSANPISPSYFQ
jgi:hypothetical protein